MAPLLIRTSNDITATNYATSVPPSNGIVSMLIEKEQREQNKKSIPKIKTPIKHSIKFEIGKPIKNFTTQKIQIRTRSSI